MQRIIWLDVARAVAVLGMVVYHFTFDLAMFGYIDPQTPVTGFWAVFARAVAGSFIALAGFGLVLSHGDGIGWTRFWRRFLILAGAAGLVSVATYFVMPGQFIYYGVLHSIAVSSLLGLAFLRLPVGVLLVAAAGVIALPMVWRSEVFDAPMLWWVGLSPYSRPSMDFEPLFPWFGPFLVGMAVARIVLARGPIVRGSAGWIGFMGRHSLVIYLAHQPVLIGLFSAWVWLNR